MHGYKTIPYHGKSLLPIFEGKQREEPEYFISGLERHRMFRQGDWKIASVNEEDWDLFNIRKDPAETENLANELPEKVQELEQAYQIQWEALCAK